MLQARSRDREFQRFLMALQCLQTENQSSAKRIARSHPVNDAARLHGSRPDGFHQRRRSSPAHCNHRVHDADPQHHQRIGHWVISAEGSAGSSYHADLIKLMAGFAAESRTLY